MDTPALISASPPPVLRTFVLATSAVLAIAAVFFIADAPSDSPTALAQSDPPADPVDYDIDDDGLIDVRTTAQWFAMDEDRNGDGAVDSGQTASIYVAAFPNAMTGMGCPLTDHDSDPMTDDVPTCTGYELHNDLDFQGITYLPIAYLPRNNWGHPHVATTFHFKGNGYRVMNIYFRMNDLPSNQRSQRGYGLWANHQGRFEGLGVWNSRTDLGNLQIAGMVTGHLAGKMIGVFVYQDPALGATWWNADVAGTFVGDLARDATLENSFVRANIGGGAGDDNAGLIGFMQGNATCKNSYWAGRFTNHSGVRAHVWAGRQNPPQNPNDQFINSNCFGASTTATGAAVNPVAVNFRENAARHPYATMASTDAYAGIFSAWNTDEDADGTLDDVWDFGLPDELPVLKAYGHDRTFPRLRTARLGQDPAHTVNICSRTLAVANEIIRHLKDDTWRDIDPPNEITELPEELESLTQCESTLQTRLVSVDHLRDYVVTSESNPFRLDPDRTSPPSDRLTSLHPDDFAYLPNASHIDISGNSLSALHPRIFDGVKLLQLNLSDNALTSLHADTFAVGAAFDPDEDPATGNYIDLSNNRLTTSGLPDRIFDDVAHMNGISLSGNAINAVNTRWFEKLGNLGRTATDDNTFQAVIGLQLAGNAITEHYYWQRALGDVRLNQAEFTGDNAGNALRTAILAAMTQAGTDTMHVDLTSTTHIANGAVGSGQCPSGLTYGPPGSVDFEGNPVQCQAVAHWTPPWQEGATADVTSVAAESSTVSITISLAHPTTTPEITAYQFRYRKHTNNANAPWTQAWRTLPLDLAATGTKSFALTNLERATVYQFQLRAISNGIAGPPHNFTQGTNAQLPTVNKIMPTVREINVPAGQQVRLEVDVYSRQDTLKNDLSDDDGASVVFQWSESPTGGGTFASPSTARRVTYTAPDLPGTYTVLAEAQPIGICASHHNSRTAPTAADRAPCIATFTIRVSRAPVSPGAVPDPVNPAGLIPTSLTDSAGIAYAVFTPVDGGTFSGEGITVSAPAGAIPDQQLLGVSAAVSTIPVPEPFPGARLTIAAPYYDINGVQRTGDAPVTAYNLDDPIRACMPIPPMFRADISDVAVISRSAPDASITILTSSIRQTATGLAACGNIGQLPATVAVANIGVIEATPEPPAPGPEDLPDTGATAPSPWANAWAMVAAALVLSVATIAAITSRRRRQHAAGIPQHDT